MFVNEATLPQEILDEYAFGLPPNTKEHLVMAITKLVNANIEYASTIEFNERVQRAAALGSGEVKSYFIPKHVKEDIQHLADVLPPVEKAKLMRLSLEDILLIKKNFEAGIYGELLQALNKKWVDIYENAPFDLSSALDYLGLPYSPEKFIQLAKQKKLPKERVQKVMEYINDEFKELDEEADQEAAVS